MSVKLSEMNEAEHNMGERLFQPLVPITFANPLLTLETKKSTPGAGSQLLSDD